MSQVCRLCLEEIADLDYLKLNDETNNVKYELEMCIPELDLDLIPLAIFCLYCARDLHASYDFKKKCIDNEQLIRNHTDGSSIPDLQTIKKENDINTKVDVVIEDTPVVDMVYVKDEEITEDDSISTKYENDYYIPEGYNSINLFLDTKHSLSGESDNESGTQDWSSSSNHTHTSASEGKIKPLPYKKPIECKRCSFKTKSKGAFKYHMENHVHKILDCPTCDFKTMHENIYLKHITIHRKSRYKCTECNFGASHKFKYQDHLNLVHSKEKNLQCTICNYKTHNLTTFKRHMNFHKREMYKCEFCHFKTQNEDAMKAHAFKEHKWINNCKCAYCKRTTVIPDTYCHTEAKPFECTVCGYRAAIKLNMIKHVKYHKGDRRFKCTKCSYNTFAMKFLQKHNKLHRERRATRSDSDTSTSESEAVEPAAEEQALSRNEEMEEPLLTPTTPTTTITSTVTTTGATIITITTAD